MDQIVANWGRFEPVSSQPAGEGARLEFVFRNAGQVEFEAREIKVGQLLADVKAYLKASPRQLDGRKLEIENLGWRLVDRGDEQYLGARPASGPKSWSREKHFDRRITIATPLKKAGAYLVTARVRDGNVSKIVVWVSDTVIVHKQLSGKSLYYIADAVDGAPVPGATVEFFGFRQEQSERNRSRLLTKEFVARGDRDGQTIVNAETMPNDFSWLVTAATRDARFAYLGFRSVWTGEYYDAQYNEVKAFCITDRPVYRPQQKVHFKFWVCRAQYDQEDVSHFAGQSFVVELHDPKGEKIDEWSLNADEYGGLEGSYDLPQKATLGQYQLFVRDHGGGSFRVEEYKKPEFEVTVEAPSEPVMLGDKVTATIQAKYYFGSPVTEATVKYKVLRANYSQDWYPVAPWDWLYGSGYWWFGYDYAWYPGWNQWAGCLRPVAWWWPRPQGPPEVVAEQEVAIGADGRVSLEIDTAIAKELHGNTDHEYTITAEVRDQSRRTIVGQGKVLVSRKPFKVFSWLDRGYYRVGGTIEAHFHAQTLAGKPVKGSGVLTLLRISYDEQRQPVEKEVQRWQLDTNEEGQAEIKLKAVAAGQYRLSYKVSDADERTMEGGYVFTVIGEGFDGTSYRFNDLELIPDQPDYQPGDKVQLQINTDRAASTVLLFVRPANGVYLPPKHVAA